jgi:predicted O-methyltransferase YrrM
MTVAGYGSRVSVMVGAPRAFTDREAVRPWCNPLLRPGGVLMTHPVGSSNPGCVTDKIHSDEATAAIVGFSRHLAADPRLYTSFLQVGDGVSVSVKRAS